MNLMQLFDLSLIGRKERIGLEYVGPAGETTALTFGEIDARSDRMAELLAARGLRRGDRLAVYLPNRPELIEIYLACLKLGIIFVPINILYREREIAHILLDAEPSAIVAAGEVPARTIIPVWLVDEMAVAAPSVASRPASRINGETAAAIIYTSGTTGASKGAVLTHDNFSINALNLTGCWQISAADRLLLVLPLFHIHALGNGLHTWLISGCRMRLLERFDHRTAVKALLDFRPTLFFGVPTVYVHLLDTPPGLAADIGQGMRLCVSGSAPLAAATLERFQGLFGQRILERYGMTETFMTLSNPYAGERRAGTVGFPLPGVTTRILGADGELVRNGEVGELLVKGGVVFSGYWRSPDATAAAFINGYFRTGDLASCSEDGYHTLHGRKGDLIISGGFNIYPREVEEFLLEQPGIREAAVVGRPDPLRGEVPVAYLVSDDAIDAQALEGRCRQMLASFKVPRAFIRVDTIPRTALGKAQKHLLIRTEPVEPSE